MNINDDMWLMLRELLSSVQMMFMRLNPLSHSAVLTGKDSTELMKRCIGPVTASPLESLKSRYAVFDCALYGTRKTVQSIFRLCSAYSGGCLSGQMLGRTALTASHTLFHFLGISGPSESQ